MKIRKGFVSNSSSTSFCIFGIYVAGNRQELEKIEEKAIKEKLCAEYDQESDGLYIGLEFDSMKDDETKSDFRQRIKTAIENADIQKNPKVDIHTEGWYNG